jgi:ribosomal protein S18 acetylase RimI-like enzyme
MTSDRLPDSTAEAIGLRFEEQQALLQAYSGRLLIGALDFTRTGTGAGIRINTIYVRPEYRRRGIGTTLTRTLSQRFPEAAFEWPPAAHGSTFLQKVFLRQSPGAPR